MSPHTLDLPFLRSQIVGVDSTFDTPFGNRLMVYCDYTASGRCLLFVEKYLQRLQRSYANTHTEDDVTGRSMTQLLHEAERIIKDAVNAGAQGRIIACGTGATGAIEKLQQMLGVEIPPATRQMLYAILERYLPNGELEQFERILRAQQPVVFVGPYEHHSNEVTWRQGLAEVVEVNLAGDGGVDLGHLEKLLKQPSYQNRLRIGSFSAASNVTGMRTPVHRIATLLHAHGALACFDYAACAPYVDIDMNPAAHSKDEDPSLDAVFFSPHKFLGGPGSSGVLVFNQRIYHSELPPTVGGGGTVEYVSADDQDFIADIEEREKAGTPGVLQTMKAALAFEVKQSVSVERIEARELELSRRSFARWQANPQVEILGNPDPERRVGIISFTVKDPRGRYLHPKFLTVLLNDLFGIQSRAGCSCAGPYGHRLLGIDDAISETYRRWVHKGCAGIKPGWCRVGLHYVMDDAEADYVIDAIDFVGHHGYRFLSLYGFELSSGAWTHNDQQDTPEPFSLEAALRTGSDETTALPVAERVKLYARYLREADHWVKQLEREAPSSGTTMQGELGEIQYFAL